MANRVEGQADRSATSAVATDADQREAEVGDLRSANNDDVVARRVKVLAQLSGALKKLEMRRCAKPLKT